MCILNSYLTRKFFLLVVYYLLSFFFSIKCIEKGDDKSYYEFRMSLSLNSNNNIIIKSNPPSYFPIFQIFHLKEAG
jgi:hypothetical protein